MQSFADWLRLARRSHRFSQEKLAARARELDENCCIYQGRLTEWEHSKGLPTFRQLVLISSILELSAEEYAEGRSLWELAELDGLPDGHVASDVVALENASTELTFENAPTEAA